MNTPRDPKQILLQILKIIDYQEDKDAYANMFIAACWEKTFFLLIDSLPKDKQKQFFIPLKEKENLNVSDTQKIIKQYFTQEQINKTVEKASKEKFTEFLKAVQPTLTKEQTETLRSYLKMPPSYT